MISIITPVLNEEENIEPFLLSIKELDGDLELIIVDGGSTDATIEKIEKCREMFGRRLKVLVSGRGRAVQMNRGVSEAEGNILLFLHVDCILEKNSLSLIEKNIHGYDFVGGGFRQGFSDPDLFLRIASGFGNLRAGLTKTFFGDYGIFLKKDIFEKIGGYDNLPFLEDVEICRKAKRYGKLVRIDSTILTSPRRYSSKGKIRLTIAFILANFLNSAGLRPGFLVKYIVEK